MDTREQADRAELGTRVAWDLETENDGTFTLRERVLRSRAVRAQIVAITGYGRTIQPEPYCGCDGPFGAHFGACPMALSEEER